MTGRPANMGADVGSHVGGGVDLVTGAGGFVGRHLVRALADAGREVVAWSRGEDEDGLRALGAAHVERFDLTDPGELEARLGARPPRRVFHLAAVAAPRRAEADPARALAVNVDATARLVAALPERTRLVFASSAAVYAPSAGDIDERAPTVAPTPPTSVYARTKLAAERAVLARRGPSVVARAFNHSGPGQSTDYALPAFALRLRRARDTGGDVTTGPLDAVRDYLHVDDVVRAYQLLADRLDGATSDTADATVGEPVPAIVNVCSGRALSMRDAFVALAERILGARRAEAVVQRATCDVSLASPNRKSNASGSPSDRIDRDRIDRDRIVGDPSALAILGFAPRVPVDVLFDGIAADPPR